MEPKSEKSETLDAAVKVVSAVLGLLITSWFAGVCIAVAVRGYCWAANF